MRERKQQGSPGRGSPGEQWAACGPPLLRGKGEGGGWASWRSTGHGPRPQQLPHRPVSSEGRTRDRRQAPRGHALVRGGVARGVRRPTRLGGVSEARNWEMPPRLRPRGNAGAPPGQQRSLRVTYGEDASGQNQGVPAEGHEEERMLPCVRCPLSGGKGRQGRGRPTSASKHSLTASSLCDCGQVSEPL